MKNNDFLLTKTLKPRAQTLRFLLQFSKSITITQGQKQKYLLHKN